MKTLPEQQLERGKKKKKKKKKNKVVRKPLFEVDGKGNWKNYGH